MNIFLLSKCPQEAARFNCDRHVLKITLESIQCLEGKTWQNHPVVKWVNRTEGNYAWTLNHANALLDEYQFRYEKDHKWRPKLNELIIKFCEENYEYVPKLISCAGMTKRFEDEFETPYLAMPDDCKTGDFVESYRNYYLKYKRHLFKWTKREIPYWVTNE